MPKRLGHLETKMLAYLQMRGQQIVRTDGLAQHVGMTAHQVQEVITRLAKNGWVARVRRGLYLAPLSLPLGGSWSPDPILAINALMEDRGATYQICGPNTFNRYGYDEQVPARLYAYNNRISGERTIGSVAITLIKVADARLGGISVARTLDGLKAVYSSRVRTLVDAVYDWSRFDSLPRAYNWIMKDLSSGWVTAAALARSAADFGNQGTMRRIGLLLELEGAPQSSLARLRKSIRPSVSLIPWNPVGPKHGKVYRRWGILLNGTD